MVAVLAEAGHRVVALSAEDPMETMGVNDRFQLAEAEAALRRRINRSWMMAGVTMVDPERTVIDAAVRLAPDVVLHPGAMLQGRTVVGSGAVLGPDVRLVDCAVGDGARIEHTVGYDAEIGPGAVVGPFAYLRPGSHIAPGTTTGQFYTAGTGDDESV